MAKLHVRYGAMNSGKSTRLIQEVHNYESHGLNVLVTKPRIDTKAGEYVSSRLGPEVKRKVDVLIDPYDVIPEIFEPIFAAKAIACVFIDEAQFLTVPQVGQLYESITLERDTPVIAYTLRRDFINQPFAAASELLSMADEPPIELPTICRCEKKARFNTRIENGAFVFEGDQVVIDGEGSSYESLCKICYFAEKALFEASKGVVAQHVTGSL